MFHDDNPKTISALLAALDEADRLIARDKIAAAEAYLAITREKYTAAQIAEIAAKPNTIYGPAPVATMKYADFMARSGLLKERPQNWKDYFFPEIHDRDGS